MGNPIKYSTTVTSGSYQKGNNAIGVNPIGYGPTANTGWYNSVTPAGGNFIVAEVIDGNTAPRFYAPTTNAEWIRLAQQEGATGANTASIDAVKSWFASQANYVVTNMDFPTSLPSIVGNGLVLNLEAGISASYPGTGTTWTDISGLGNNAGLFNGVSFNNNGWLNFDGIDDYVYLNSPDRPPLLSPDNVSVNILFKTQQTSNGILLRNRTYGYGLYITNGGIAGFAYYDGGLLVSYDSGAGFITTNKWYLATLTFGNSFFKIYLNGNQLSGNLSVGTNIYYPAGAKAVGIGRDADASNTYLNGSVSSVQIYNKALTQAEILQNYHQAPIVTDGLVFAADAGNLVSYESGSTLTYSLTGSISGSLTNGVGYNSGNGGSWGFDGVDDYIGGNFSIDAGSNFSVFAWIKPGNINIRNAIVGNSYPYSQRQGFFLSTGTGYLGTQNTFFLSIGSDAAYRTAANDSITRNVWNYVGGTVTNGGQDIKLYVNGIETSYFGGILSSGSVTYSTNEFYIGRRTTSTPEPFIGEIASTVIYNKVLTATEIAQNFNAQRNRFGI